MAKSYEVPKDKEFSYKKDYESDWDIHRGYINEFDAYEAMLQSQVFDSISRRIDGSKITDGYATTLAKERADRVVAKLPEGNTEPAGQADVGKAAFMDILRQKWIYPNANAQHPFLEKLNMWQFYSSVYGYMPMFYDWNVSPTGYVGPDCWLWNPRNLIPQQGRSSIADMDYVTALTWVSKKFLQDKLDNLTDGDGWDKEALELLIEIADEKSDVDQDKDTQISRTRTPQATKKGICLATRYEAGEDGDWCSFAPDHSCIQVREIKNPHKNGRIPFIIKYSQPLFDSFYGLGDFQRAKPLQFARDALDNFYFKGIKINLIPPIIANANGVLKHTLDYREGGVMLETLPNSIRRLETSPAGLATYQGAKQAMTGSLLSQFGSQNAAISGAEAQNPSQGRTPAAIGFYNDKEQTRDGAELRHLESAIEQLIDGFNSLIVNIGTEDVPVALFAEDIKQIQEAGLNDVNQLFKPNATGTGGVLRINPAALKGIEYRFNINPASTVKANKDAEVAALERLMGAIGKFQNIFKDDPRVDVNWGEMMTAYEKAAGIKGASKFVTYDSSQPSPHQLQMQMEQMKNQPEPQKAEAPKQLINYKDAPEDIKRQMEQADGYQPSQNPMTPDMALKAHQADTKHQTDQAKVLLDAHQTGHQQQLDSAQLDQQAQTAQLSADQQQFDQANTIQQNQQSAQQAEKSHALAEKTQADSHEVAKTTAKQKSVKVKK
jgi:hypothetical protein